MSIFEYFSGPSENKRAIDIIKNMCSEAGWRIKEVTADGVVLGFNTDIGVQHVFVRRCGTNKLNEMIIEISTQGIPLPGELSTAALMSLALMERNGEMLIGHWGIESIGGTKHFSVMHSAVASTLDKEEFEAAVLGCLDERSRFLLSLKNG